MKSKRYTRNQKLTVIPIIVSSDDDDIVYIGKKNEKQKFKKQRSIRQCNKREYDNIRKGRVERLLDIQEKIDCIPILNSQTRPLISYKVEGDIQDKYVCDLYLQERLKKIVGGIRKVEKKVEQTIASVVPSRKEKEKEKENVHRTIRYFYQQQDEDDNCVEGSRLIRCHRCGHKGHAIKNCFSSVIQTKCMYCLGNHWSTECQAKCYKCNNEGHIANKCRANIKDNDQYCGSIMDLHKSFRSNFENENTFDQEDVKKIKCLSCKEIGHFNCHKYQNLSLYESSKRTKPNIYLPKAQNKYRFTNFDGELAIQRTISNHFNNKKPQFFQQRNYSQWQF